MTGGSKKKGGLARDKRLAAALRENLKRRKAQERSRADPESAAKPTPPSRTDKAC
jgi:hypothetical protein